MKYSDGTAISLGDKVKLGNGELGTVDALFADLTWHYPSDGYQPNTPGVLVITDKGARVLLNDLQADDLFKCPDQRSS